MADRVANVYEEFRWRGLIYDATEGLEALLARERVTAYIGFDPTAPSLHVGSLLPVMALARLQRFGHVPIAIVGGGTGLIGDPSGKSQERPLLTVEEVERNLRGIRSQLMRFLDFDAPANPARVLNNAEWLGGLNLMTFLREVGKHFTVNALLAKESVKRRLESDEGISFTEFSYVLLQAYDFLVLHDRFGCQLQLGGSDQWGNITAGCDLIRRVRGTRVHGLVLPLVTTAAGTKFGKTEVGTVWLDPALTSPYRFYQFWFNTDDRDVAAYLRFFTFLSSAEIAELDAELARAPERREAQRVLARELTRLVHGAEALARAERASEVLFGRSLAGLSAEEVLAVFDDVPATEVARSRFDGEGMPVVELVAATGLTGSKSEAVRLIRGGGIYVNDERVGDEKARLTLQQAIDGRLFVLRKGARERHLVKLVG
jgi:tyrosyl-tRNA synthetase